VRDLPDDDTWNHDRRQAIGANVREERQRQQLTQDQVWIAARINRWTLQRVEAGQDVKLSTLLRIAWVLDVPLADLVR
jgi:predicted transcriptional regulator